MTEEPFLVSTGNDGYSDDGYSGLNPPDDAAIADKFFGNYDKN